MRSKTLKFKVVLYLAIALTLAMLAFTALVVRHQREELLREAVSRVAQISDVIKKSTRFAMLTNQPAYVDNIIRDVGNQGNIEKVRILSKDGTIIHSTYPPELGLKVDRRAEACVLCHESDAPLEQVPQSRRSRIFATPAGTRMLGSMDVIRNEPSCYTANCHQHSKSTSVLGVLDIVYSLDEIDRTMRTNAITMAVLMGTRGPTRDIVLLNAAAAIVVAGLADELPPGVARLDGLGHKAFREGIVLAGETLTDVDSFYRQSSPQQYIATCKSH